MCHQSFHQLVLIDGWHKMVCKVSEATSIRERVQSPPVGCPHPRANIITWMGGILASHLAFWLAVADWCEVLATLDGGASSCRVRSCRLLDIFHFHFFMMYPKIGRPEVLLTALPLARTVRGPFPMWGSERADVEWCGPTVRSIFPHSVQVASKETKGLPGGIRWNPQIGRLVLAVFPFLPQSLSTFLGDAELNPQGPRCLPERSLSPASAAGDSCPRWQWVGGSHMPIFGGRHKVPDCNICFRDKWTGSHERADRNKKARICANS